jgi:hypothetical protein
MLFRTFSKSKKAKTGDYLCSEIRRLEGHFAQCCDLQTLQDLVDVYSVLPT